MYFLYIPILDPERGLASIDGTVKVDYHNYKL
jgi:hypothetical protein